MHRSRQLPADLVALLDRQDGVLTRDQLAAHGFDDGYVYRRIRGGLWQRILPGVVLTCTGEPTRRQRLIAAVQWAGPGCAVDGQSACDWYGLRSERADPRQVHIVTPNSSSARTQSFVIVRRAIADIRVGDRGHVPYVDPPTAVVVAARGTSGARAAVSTLSRALQQGLVTLADLAEARDNIGDKWCRPVDSALTTVGVGLRSPAERDMRELLLTSSLLPEPRWNQWLALDDGGPDVCVDGLWDEAAMVNEVIGRKYHAWAAAYEHTNARKERLQAMGLEVCEATPIRIRTDAAALLRNLERIYLRQPKLGLPDGVHLLDGPRNRGSLRRDAQ